MLRAWQEPLVQFTANFQLLSVLMLGVFLVVCEQERRSLSSLPIFGKGKISNRPHGRERRVSFSKCY